MFDEGLLDLCVSCFLLLQTFRFRGDNFLSWHNHKQINIFDYQFQLINSKNIERPPPLPAFTSPTHAKMDLSSAQGDESLPLLLYMHRGDPFHPNWSQNKLGTFRRNHSVFVKIIALTSLSSKEEQQSQASQRFHLLSLMLETIDFYKYSLPFELQYSNSTDQSMEREEAPMYEQRRSQGQYRKNRQQSQSRRSWRKLRQKVQIRTPSEQRELSYNYLSQLRQWEDKLDSIRIQLLSKQQLLLAQTKVLGISQQKDKESERVFWIKEIQQTEATLKQLFEQEKEVEKKIDKLKYYDDENVQNFKQWSKEQERDLREQHIEDQHQRRRALKAQVNLMHSSHQRSVSQAYQSQLRQKANKIILSRKMRGFKDKCLIEQTLCLSKAKEAYKLQWTGMVQKSRAAIIEFKEKEREAEQELEKLRKAYNAHKLKYKLRSKVYL